MPIFINLYIGFCQCVSGYLSVSLPFSNCNICPWRKWLSSFPFLPCINQGSLSVSSVCHVTFANDRIGAETRLVLQNYTCLDSHSLFFLVFRKTIFLRQRKILTRLFTTQKNFPDNVDSAQRRFLSRSQTSLW